MVERCGFDASGSG